MLRKACSNTTQLHVRGRGSDQSDRSGAQSHLYPATIGRLDTDPSRESEVVARKMGQVSVDGVAILTTPYMTHLPDFHQNSSTPPYPCEDSHIAGFNLYLSDSPSASRYQRLAVQALLEYSQELPDVQRLTLIVEAALSAQALYFAAAAHDPDTVELHQFFETFVLACVIPPEKRSTP